MTNSKICKKHKIRCLTCKKLFSEYICSRRKYCSYGCFYKRNGNRIYKNCLMCKKEFKVIPAERHLKYCSQKCYHLSRITKDIIKNCLVCKKTFIVKNCNFKAKYCSHSCASKISGKIVGPIIDKINKINKKGIYEMTHEEHVRTGKMGSLLGSVLGGTICRDKKIGICGLTNIQRAIYGKKAAETNRKNKTGICHDYSLREKYPIPINDTLIEVKIQDFLIQLQIEYLAHKHMDIKHGYRCDIYIPSMSLVIECDGDFIHCNPNKYPSDYVRFPTAKKIITAQNIWDKDKIRTQELQEKGFRVIRLWGSEIKKMELEDLKTKLEN